MASNPPHYFGVEHPNYKHGLSTERLYKIYRGMIERCTNPKAAGFDSYGGRGITICEEWRQATPASIMSFYAWAASSGYRDELSLERKDVDGNYCPENCTWISKADQHKNKRQTVWVELNGEKLCLKEACNKIGNVKYKTAVNRVLQGMDPIDAITLPTTGPDRPGMGRIAKHSMKNRTYDIFGETLYFDEALLKYSKMSHRVVTNRLSSGWHPLNAFLLPELNPNTIRHTIRKKFGWDPYKNPLEVLSGQ